MKCSAHECRVEKCALVKDDLTWNINDVNIYKYKVSSIYTVKLVYIAYHFPDMVTFSKIGLFNMYI